MGNGVYWRIEIFPGVRSPTTPYLNLLDKSVQKVTHETVFGLITIWSEHAVSNEL